MSAPRRVPFSVAVAGDPALQAVCEDLVVNGRHWELTSYEWNPRTGVARFGYVHRFTGKHMDTKRIQSHYTQPIRERQSVRWEDRRAA